MTASVQPTSPDNSVAQAAASIAPVDPNQVAGQSPVTGATKVGSMGELQKKAPQLYKAILFAIAMRIRSDQEESMRRFKEIQREGQRQ